MNKKWKSNIHSFAAELEKNLPASEKWFRELYQEFVHKNDKYNKPFNDMYIPDVINYKLKYIIEIDDPTHNKPEIRVKDKKKTLYYVTNGFTVFRLKAYDNQWFKEFIKYMIEYRLCLSRNETWEYYCVLCGIDLAGIDPSQLKKPKLNKKQKMKQKSNENKPFKIKGSNTSANRSAVDDLRRRTKNFNRKLHIKRMNKAI